VRALTRWVLAALGSPAGLVALAALDSSVLLVAPFALDATVIVLVAHHPTRFWIFPLLATTGSLVGAAVTYWMGRKLGEHGLDRFVTARRLERALSRARATGAAALAMLAIIPPPFPFTPVILAAGVLELDFWHFLAALAAARLARFGIETGLALVYGRQIVAWLESDIVKIVAGTIGMAMLAATGYTIVRLTRQRRPQVTA
jgi:membrane protein YqaA with SNARE-associated domain